MNERTSPYLLRNAILSPDMFFGRKRESTFVESRIRATQPQSTEIVGFRRIGKSSLLNAISRSFHEPLSAGQRKVVPVRIDGQEFAKGTVRDFFRSLLRQLRLEEVPVPKGAAATYSGVREILETLKASNCHITIMIDEFEMLTRNPEFDVEFFSFLRGLANNSSISYVIASVQGIRTCPNKELAGSPFFNIFHTLSLGCLTEEEALQLICIPSKAANFPLENHAGFILRLSGRFPMFVQIACSVCFEFRDQVGARVLDYKWVNAKFQSDVHPLFEDMWNHFTHAERAVCKQLAAKGTIDPHSRSVVNQLESRGVVTEESGVEELFSAVFEAYVRSLDERFRDEGENEWDDASDVLQTSRPTKADSGGVGRERSDAIVVQVDCRVSWPTLRSDEKNVLSKKFKAIVSSALDRYPSVDQRLTSMSAIVIYESSDHAANAAISILTATAVFNGAASSRLQLQIRIGIAQGEYLLPSGVMAGSGLDLALKLCNGIEASIGLAVAPDTIETLPRELAAQFRPALRFKSGQTACYWDGDVSSVSQSPELPIMEEKRSGLVPGVSAMIATLIVVSGIVVGIYHYVPAQAHPAIYLVSGLFLIAFCSALFASGRIEWQQFREMVGAILPTLSSRSAVAGVKRPASQKKTPAKP